MTNLAHINQESLIDNQSLRDKYIGRIDLLNRVKLLSLLPDDEHMTTQMVADYYEVGEEAINSLIKDHRSELELDGLTILFGYPLKSYKNTCQIKSRARHMTIIPRRAILRIGMLLRDSEVAKQIRTYLLDVEKLVTKDCKKECTRFGDRMWTSQEESILLNAVQSALEIGGNLGSAFQKASEKLNRTKNACQALYFRKLKGKVKPDMQVIEEATSNFEERLLTVVENLNRETIGLLKNENKQFIERINEIKTELINCRKHNSMLRDELLNALDLMGRAEKLRLHEKLNLEYQSYYQ